MSIVTSKEASTEIVAVSFEVSAAHDVALPVATVISSETEVEASLTDVNNLLSQIEARNQAQNVAMVQGENSSSGIYGQIFNAVNGTNMAGMCILYCLIVLLVMGIIGASMALFVFDVIGLNETSNEQLHSECKDSNIFAFVIVVILFPCLQPCFTTQDEQKRKSLSGVLGSLCSVGLLVGIFIWGTYEIFGVSCVPSIEDTTLYKVAYIHWVLLTIGVGIVFVAFFSPFFVLCCCSKSPMSEPNSGLPDATMNHPL